MFLIHLGRKYKNIFVGFLVQMKSLEFAFKCQQKQQFFRTHLPSLMLTLYMVVSHCYISGKAHADWAIACLSEHSMKILTSSQQKKQFSKDKK